MFLGLFNKKREKNLAKYLIVGLGNIGQEYESTRHNVGFMFADALVENLGGVFTPDRYASTAEVRWKGRIIKVIKPATYMNLSGKAVRYWLDKERIDKQNLIVIVDDIALPLTDLRIRTKGADGGHNGLKNIDALNGGNDYARMRIGVGGDFPQGHQVDYVLSKFSKEEIKALEPTTQNAIEAIKCFVTQGIERTMNLHNHKKKRTPPKHENTSIPEKSE